MDSQKGKSHQTEWQAPNPKRFEKYAISKDGRSFTIEGSTHEFVFDEQGGWLDEFGNYYDANGNPLDYDDDHYDDDKYDGYDVEDAEKFVLEYDLGGGHDEEDDQLHHFDNIYTNAEGNKKIDSILDNTTIQIEVSNINYQVREDDFKRYLAQHVKVNFDKCEFERLDGRRHKGKCIVSISNKQDAHKIVGINNKPFEGRNLKVQVLTTAVDEDEDIPTSAGGAISNIKPPAATNQILIKNPPGINTNVVEKPVTVSNSRPNTAPVSNAPLHTGKNLEEGKIDPSKEKNPRNLKANLLLTTTNQNQKLILNPNPLPVNPKNPIHHQLK